MLNSRNDKGFACQTHVLIVFLSLVIGFIPFITYLCLVKFDDVFGYIYGKTVALNFFTYYRALWLQIITITAMIWFAFKETAKPSKYHTPMLMYAWLAILSTIFSEYTQTAFWGDVTRHEGLLTNLCYMGILYLFTQLSRSAAVLKIFIFSAILSATILAMIGSLQFLGEDFFHTAFAQKFMISAQVKRQLPDFVLKNNIEQKKSITSTFGNQITSGTYMTMMFALSLALLLGSTDKRRFLLCPINILIAMNVLGSTSRTCIFSGIVAFIMIVVLLRKYIKDNLKLLAFLVVMYILTAFTMDAYSLRKNQHGFFQASLLRAMSSSIDYSGRLKDIKLLNDSAAISFEGSSMSVKFTESGLEFYDHENQQQPYRLFEDEMNDTTESLSNNNQKLDSSSDSNGEVRENSNIRYAVVFPAGIFRGWMLHTWPDKNILQIKKGNVKFSLVFTANGFELLDHTGRASKIREVASFGFDGYERLFTTRGYIWARSLPLLTDTLLIGYGPDTFAAYFPNHDLLGKLKFVNAGISMIINKPHSMYLQNAINTGVVSLVALLAIFFMYLVESAKLYYKGSIHTFSQLAGSGIAVAVLTYLAAGLINDSSVAVAPFFWALLGIGIAANRINQESLDSEASSNSTSS